MRIWSLTHCKLHVSKYCLIIFNTLWMLQTPSRTKCQHNYCFRVFWYVRLYAYPKRFFGGSESCAYFRNNIPFFRPSSCFLWSDDFDNQQHFVLNSLWLIVCHWWAGIFANKFRHFDKTIVMCRSVTRLDGAWGKKQVWRPHVRTWGLSEANVGLLFWKKWLWHCCDFMTPVVIRRPRHCASLTSRYVSGVMQ